MRTLVLLGLLALAGNLLATALPNVKVSVSGTVLAGTNSPLEYATVSAFTTDSLLLDGTVTTADGKFELQLPRGDYRLRVEFIGFTAKELEVAVTGKTDLGEINLSTGGVDLTAVEVRAERSSMSLRLDKKVFNVGKDALASGGSANEVLEQIPSVTVSADGAVALRGDGGVTILINGRPSALANRGGLSGIPASSIESVEVITNPSSRYEAAGTAGILNIILKQEKTRGYGGNINVGTGVPDNHTLDVNLNFRTEKLSGFANVGGRYSNFNGSGALVRNSTINNRLTRLVQTTKQRRNDLAASGFFGLDYNLSEQEQLSGSYSVFHMRNDDISTIDYTFSSPDPSAPAAAPDRVLRQVTDYLEPGTYQQIDLTYAKRLEGDRKLNVYFKNDRWVEPEFEDIGLTQSLPTQSEAFRYRTETDEGSTDYMLQADYESPLGEHGQLEVGARAETRIISADYQAEKTEGGGFVPIPGFTNDLNYFERIGAAYLQYGYTKESFSLQAGLRAEGTIVRTEDELEATEEVKQDYLNFFPSLSLQYRLTDALSSQVSYSRRIRRPSFWMINPFGGISNPTNLYRGNPAINPIYINRLEWNLLLRTDKLTLSPAVYASRVQDYFKVIYEQEADNIFGLDDGTVIATPVNLGNEDLLGLEVTANYQATEAFSIGGEINYFGFRESGTFEGRDFAITGGTWGGSMRSQLRLAGEVNLQASVAYNAPRRDVQELIKSSYYLNLGASKRWKDKYTISANLRSTRFRNTESFRPTFFQTDDFQWTGWRASLTFRYRFEKGATANERRMRGSIR